MTLLVLVNQKSGATFSAKATELLNVLANSALVLQSLCGTINGLAGLSCRVDMVLVGAEGVVENGGVINKLGTFQAALAASCHNIPFYVAAESYKVQTCYLQVPNVHS